MFIVLNNQAKVYGVDWNLNEKQLISSAAWDHTVKVWDAMRGAPFTESLTSKEDLSIAASDSDSLASFIFLSWLCVRLPP